MLIELQIALVVLVVFIIGIAIKVFMVMRQVDKAALLQQQDDG